MSRVVIGGAVPVGLFISVVLGLLSFDFALGGISVMFSIALVPGIMENRKNHRGWSKQSTVMTASGLLSMGTMFVLLGLPLTGGLTILSGVLWSVLVVQAFVYSKPVASA